MARPEAAIPWKTVEDLLIAGCSGRDIAGYLGIDPNTLYERSVKDLGLTFSQYSQQFYSKGDSLLKAHQYAKALGKVEGGDNTLLIWLGKVRLKQRENDEHVLPPQQDQINLTDTLIKQQARIAELEAQVASKQ